MSVPYTKRSLSIDEQIRLLEGRGMQFANEEKARRVLLTCNYYRLRGYWIPFEIEGIHEHQFKPGTRFEEVLKLYRFDEALRHMLASRLGKIEISVRTAFAYYLSRMHESMAYRKAELFNQKPSEAKGKWNYKDALDALDDAFAKSHEQFAKKLKEKYDHPPIWAATEVMSFGQLSIWLSNLVEPESRRAIAKQHGFDNAKTFRRFIHTASVVRNICAHQDRLTNRPLGVLPPYPYHPEKLIKSWQREERKIYNFLILLEYAIDYIQPGSGMGSELKALSEKYSVNLNVLGFPGNWEDLPMWSAA